jgi:hypothetical protein
MKNLRWEIACLNFPNSWIPVGWDIAGLVPEGNRLRVDSGHSGHGVFSYSARASSIWNSGVSTLMDTQEEMKTCVS